MLSPVMLFPLFYVVLALVMGFGVYRRWRAGLVFGWQLAMSWALKVVPVVAFGYAWWWSAATRDDIGGFLMFTISAVVATVLGLAWVLFDVLGLGVWRRD